MPLSVIKYWHNSDSDSPNEVRFHDLPFEKKKQNYSGCACPSPHTPMHTNSRILTQTHTDAHLNTRTFNSGFIFCIPVTSPPILQLEQAPVLSILQLGTII